MLGPPGRGRREQAPRVRREEAAGKETREQRRSSGRGEEGARAEAWEPPLGDRGGEGGPGCRELADGRQGPGSVPRGGSLGGMARAGTAHCRRHTHYQSAAGFTHSQCGSRGAFSAHAPQETNQPRSNTSSCVEANLSRPVAMKRRGGDSTRGASPRTGASCDHLQALGQGSATAACPAPRWSCTTGFVLGATKQATDTSGTLCNWGGSCAG